MEKLKEDLSKLLEKVDHYDSIEQKVKSQPTKNDRIKLNVGGKIFCVSKKILIKEEGTYFLFVLSHPEQFLCDDDGAYFIDRNPKIFPYILDYLRDGEITEMEEINNVLVRKILKEAQFFKITGLIEKFNFLIEKPKFIKYEYSGIYIDAKSQDTLESIMDGNENTGICAISPGWIVLRLNRNVIINNITVCGYGGYKSGWGKTNGSGAKINISADGFNWEEIPEILPDLNSIKKIVLSNPKKAIAIKFVHNSYLGLSIVNINT